ncbi:putative efflux protein, MATE family [Lachnospiraceae bacterium C10]|nr:putative efflux protein, MATE family [Lachnospiraceae bacterium C10]
MTAEEHLVRLRNGQSMTLTEKLNLVARLSLPSMMAQISTVIMEYIDSGMVGHLGRDATASIGLVMTSLWLVGGLCTSFISGFTIQTALAIGAKDEKRARSLTFQSFFVVTAIALLICIAGSLIHNSLPVWLGGKKSLVRDAGGYFLIFCLFMPVMVIRQLCNGLLTASGNMKVPGILNTLVCFLDVIFNYICIYPGRAFSFFGTTVVVKGLGLGVRGAALGSGLSEVVVGGLSLYFLMKKGSMLRLRRAEKYHLVRKDIVRAVMISLPMMFERLVMNVAQVAYTMIISPLGNVALAANSFAITTESLCYMPGYGVADAASTLVGQSIGAGRKKTAISFGKITLSYGMVLQGGLGVVMFFIAPWMIGLLSPDPEVVKQAVLVLRIEAVVEAFYGAQIVASGIFRGAEDTFVPSLMNFFSVWVVRIPLALLFTKVFRLGLLGVWIAMATELFFRGVIFLVRFFTGRWMKRHEKWDSLEQAG